MKIELDNELEEWGYWYCPHPDCEDGRKYQDPESIFTTCCDKGHVVNLIGFIGNSDNFRVGLEE